MLHKTDIRTGNLEDGHRHGLLKIPGNEGSKAHSEKQNHHVHMRGGHHHHHRHGGAVRRSVRFAGEPDVRQVESFKDLENKNELWYTTKDYQRILLDDCEKTLLHMMTNNNNKDTNDDDETSFCTRGLEDKTLKGSIRHTRHILSTLQAVLEEQMMQWEDCIYYPERLACISKSTSCTSKAVALKLGKKDEAEVFGHNLKPGEEATPAA